MIYRSLLCIENFDIIIFKDVIEKCFFNKKNITKSFVKSSFFEEFKNINEITKFEESVKISHFYDNKQI